MNCEMYIPWDRVINMPNCKRVKNFEVQFLPLLFGRFAVKPIKIVHLVFVTVACQKF